MTDYNTDYIVVPVPAMKVCGKWSTAPYIRNPRHEMEVSGQHYAPSALTPEKEPPVLVE